MGIGIEAKWNREQLGALDSLGKGAIRRILGKAGATALRDMRSEAVKRIRRRKAIRPKYIARAITMRRPSGGTSVEAMEWAVQLDGDPVPLVAYPHRQLKAGVAVEVNKGKRTIVKGSFKATMKSGHQGVFERQGKARLPIRELRGSRPVDALLHKGEADGVAARGGKSFGDTFMRLLPLEIGK